jgi:hypothetical protein
MFRLSTGGVAFVPRGTPHCFQNVGDAPGRMLIVYAPSGMERFFEQYAGLLPGPVDPQKVTAVAEANWMEILGPPLAESDPLQDPPLTPRHCAPPPPGTIRR